MNAARRKALAFHDKALACLENPRISVDLRLSLAEYLDGIPTSERSNPLLRSELEIQQLREACSEVARETASKARSGDSYLDVQHTVGGYAAIVNPQASETIPLSCTGLDSAPAWITAQFHKRSETANRATKTERVTLVCERFLGERASLAREAASSAISARERSGAERDYLAQHPTVTATSPKPFQGLERFGMLRSAFEARELASSAPSGSGATYVSEYTPEGCYSHARLATLADRATLAPLAPETRSELAEYTGAGVNGLLVVADCVCNRSFPAPDSNLLRSEARELASSEARETSGARLAPRVSVDVVTMQAREARRIEQKRARFDGIASKRGKATRKRGKRKGCSEAAR